MSYRTNTVLSSLAAWIFGLATSVLFVSLWGRAVVIDTDELADNLLPLSQTEQVASAFSDWMTTELVESGVPARTAEDATQAATVTNEVSVALRGIVVDVVDAAATDGVDGGTVDIASKLEPTVPAVTVALVETGLSVTEAQVGAAVRRIDPLVIRAPGEPPSIGGKSPLASRLGTAAILAVLFQVIFASVYVLAAPDRLKRMRTLLNRFALTGLSFAVLLRLGSWVLDPEGGRAPVSESLSLLADSKWVLPALLGGAGAVGALFVWLVRASRATPGAVSLSPTEAAIPRPD